MASPTAAETLSKRERQIMDIVFATAPVSVEEVRQRLPDPPTYSSVRATMAILERKGHLRHEVHGKRYVYLPTQPRSSAGRSALQRVVQTFFRGAPIQAFAALLDASGDELSESERQRLRAMIDEAQRKRQRG